MCMTFLKSGEKEIPAGDKKKKNKRLQNVYMFYITEEQYNIT